MHGAVKMLNDVVTTPRGTVIQGQHRNGHLGLTRRTARTQRGQLQNMDQDRASAIGDVAKRALNERRSNAVNNDRRQRFLDQHRESLRSKGLDPKLARGNSMRSLPMAGALPRPEKHVIQSLKTNKQDMPSAAVLPAPRRVWDGTAPPQSAMAEMENKRGYSVAMPPRLVRCGEIQRRGQWTVSRSLSCHLLPPMWWCPRGPSMLSEGAAAIDL